MHFFELFVLSAPLQGIRVTSAPEISMFSTSPINGFSNFVHLTPFKIFSIDFLSEFFTLEYHIQETFSAFSEPKYGREVNVRKRNVIFCGRRGKDHQRWTFFISA